MSDKIEYSRMLIKRTDQTGEQPTIPPITATTLNQFIPTDLFVGEMFVNVSDDLMWIRTNTGILPISLSGSTGTTGNYLPLSGGVVTGDTTFTQKLYLTNLTNGGSSTYLTVDSDTGQVYTATGSGGGGTSGTSGTSGLSGTSGISGTSGTSGLSGTSGISGTSGTSGQGTSGTSGISASGSTFPFKGDAVITGSLTMYNTGNTNPSLVVSSVGDVYNRGVSGITTNTFFGEGVGRLTSGTNNTAFGYQSLLNNTTGLNNVSIGGSSLQSNIGGLGNTAIGHNALANNINATNNNAIGLSSMVFNTTGISNSALGRNSLFNNTTGSSNIALGDRSLEGNTTGNFNIGIGLLTNSGNFSNSIIIGNGATATANNQLVIGSSGTPVGTLTTESLTSTRTFTIRINGVDRKFLLA